VTAPLDLWAIEELLASLPLLAWRGCQDHPEHNSNSGCWGIYNASDRHAEKLRLVDVGEQLVALRNAAPQLIGAARELAELKSALEWLKAHPNDLKITLPAPLEHYVNVARALGWTPGAQR
jgi:hypothetical protein